MANFYKSYIKSNDNKTFSIPMKNLGAPTNPMVAKQLEEFGKLLNQGIKNVEIGTISADKFEFIPKQHFEEIRRLAKITDSNISVHAPLVDLAGFPEQGQGRWSEDQRKETEERLYSILQRSFQLTNKESVPVVFHAGHMQAQEYQKDMYVTQLDENGDIIRDEKVNPVVKKQPLGFRSIVAVNQDTGDVTKLDYEEKYYFGKDKPEIWDPMKRLHSTNSTYWDQEREKITTRFKELEKVKEKFELKSKQNEAIEKSGLTNDPNYQQLWNTNNRDMKIMQDDIEIVHSRLASEYQNLYDKFIRFSSDKVKEHYQEQIKKTNEEYQKKDEEIKVIYRDLNQVRHGLSQAEDQETVMKLNKIYEEKQKEILQKQLEQSTGVLHTALNLPAPKLWRYVGEFAIEKTADTVANAMARMYVNTKKEGKGEENKIPFVAMENFFVGSSMSTAKDLKAAVNQTREKLAKELVDNKEAGLSRKEAEKVAEKLVGATWDVGHINNLRKAGFEGEELKKKVLEETKEIAEVTKHVHITDNFGFHDSHLPPGMGNVPIREIMEQLEKKWGELADQGKLPQHPRGIVEAGGFVGEIGQNPTLAILEYFNSPLSQATGAPYAWGPTSRSISNTSSPYFESFIEFPQQHFSLYGSSFTTLPKSVGGQVGEGSSRFSGTPNQ